MAGSAPVPNNNTAPTDAAGDQVNGETGAFANPQVVDATHYSTVPTLSNLDAAR